MVGELNQASVTLTDQLLRLEGVSNDLHLIHVVHVWTLYHEA